MSKDLIIKDNALINASYNLELAEQRLILLAISEARLTNQKIDSNSYLTIHAEKYINKFSVHKNVAYQALKDACNHLFERRFSYQKLTPKGNREIVTSRWVQSISYIENEAIVRIKFSDDVTPLISNLEKHFTSYELEQVAELSSKYSVRLYEIVISWQSIGKTPMLTIDELRERLGVSINEYSELRNLKARVIDSSINQINNKTDISICYRQHKDGRKITGFTFFITQKIKKVEKLNSELVCNVKDIDLFEGLTKAERQAVQERVNKYIKYIESRGDSISNFHRNNITKKAIAERWGIEIFQEKQRLIAEEKSKVIEQAQIKTKELHKIEEEQRRIEIMIAKFESLSSYEQEYTLNKVATHLDGIYHNLFKQARAKGVAHKDKMFIYWFLEILDRQGVSK